MVPIQVVILCGGKGERMGCTTQKCMILFMGKPIIEYLLDVINDDLGCCDVTLVVGHFYQDICYGSKYKKLKLKYVISTGGTRKAVVDSGVKGNFFLIDGDIIIKSGWLKKLMTRHLGTILYSKKFEIAPTHASLTVDGGMIKKLDYPSKRDDTGPRCMDVAFYSREMMKYLLRYSYHEQFSKVLRDLVDINMSGDGLFRGVEYTEKWLHFAYQEDLLMRMDD